MNDTEKTIGMTLPHGTEQCVCCGRDTGIPFSTPINDRTCYVVGCGQLCWSCYVQLCSDADERLLTHDEMNTLIAMCQKKKWESCS